MPVPLLLSVIILSSLMIGITQYFHHTDTTEEVKDKVRLVFPIFIISISFCILLNKDGYIVAVFSFFCSDCFHYSFILCNERIYPKIKMSYETFLFLERIKFHIPYYM